MPDARGVGMGEIEIVRVGVMVAHLTVAQEVEVQILALAPFEITHIWRGVMNTL